MFQAQYISRLSLGLDNKQSWEVLKEVSPQHWQFVARYSTKAIADSVAVLLNALVAQEAN